MKSTSKVGITVANITSQHQYSSLRATPGVVQNVVYTGTGFVNAVIVNMPDVSPTLSPSFTLSANQITINESGHYLLSYTTYIKLNTAESCNIALCSNSIPISRSVYSIINVDIIYASVTGTYNLFAGQVITLRTYLDASATTPLDATIQSGLVTILKLKE